MTKEIQTRLVEINKFLQLFTSGAKSFESIRTKFAKMDGAIGDVKDLIRATLLVKSFDEVPSLLVDLSKFFHNFHGDIARSSSGYHGIHTNLMFDGFRTELQIATPKTLEAKKEDDFRYHRLRDIRYELQKFTNSDTHNLINVFKLEKERNLIELQSDVARKRFKQIYAEANLFNALPQIQSLLAFYTAKSIDMQIYNLDILNSKDKDDKLVMEVSKLAANSQQNFEEYVVENLQTFQPTLLTLPDEIEQITKFRNKLHNALINLLLKNSISDEEVQSNMKAFTKYEDQKVVDWVSKNINLQKWNIEDFELEDVDFIKIFNKKKEDQK